MSTSPRSSDPARSWVSATAERQTWRGRLTGPALMVVLLSVSGFVLWSSTATSTAVDAAVRANDISDDYAQAANDIGAEESLERKYRLGPDPEVRAEFDAAAADLISTLQSVRVHGTDADRALVDRVIVDHAGYNVGMEQMFDAVDRGDLALVQQIDARETEPRFESIETIVLDAATDRRAIFLERVAELHDLQKFKSTVIPVVLLTGIVLAGLLMSVSRADRRRLEDERARALNDSLHDSLTGLPNRTLLAERCALALSNGQRFGTRTGLLLIDLDRFKEINDTFGHHYGDALLHQVGERLSQALRAGDVVARLGGDEFAVLLHDVSVHTARGIANNLRTTLEAPFSVDGVDLDVEASVGLVVSDEHGTDPATLLQHADIAMYVAKKRNCGVFSYDPTIDAHTPAKLALLGDLRRALERDELALHYQPKVSLTTGDVVGAEALVRWHHPTRGLVMPDEFIPLAEHTGLIGPLTTRVLDMAIRQARVWIEAGQPLAVSVNLSARSLVETRLPDQISAILVANGVPATLLELEVTESALMTEPERAHLLLERLSVLGIRISIDDFGAGYTSLGQLRTLPLDELKIDRSFVATMTDDPSSALIVRSVIDLGHNLGLTIVAEGAESELTAAALTTLGCDVVQGFVISRALTPGDLDVWRAERRLRAIRESLAASNTMHSV